jgi:hypothetical protein
MNWAEEDKVLRYCCLETIVGRLLVAGDEEGLRYISFMKGKHVLTPEVGWREDPTESLPGG